MRGTYVVDKKHFVENTTSNFLAYLLFSRLSVSSVVVFSAIKAYSMILIGFYCFVVSPVGQSLDSNLGVGQPFFILFFLFS